MIGKWKYCLMASGNGCGRFGVKATKSKKMKYKNMNDMIKISINQLINDPIHYSIILY